MFYTVYVSFNRDDDSFFFDYLYGINIVYKEHQLQRFGDGEDYYYYLPFATIDEANKCIAFLKTIATDNPDEPADEDARNADGETVLVHNLRFGETPEEAHD